EPGLNKNELVGEILRDAARGEGDAGGDYAAIVPLLPSGAGAAAPHLTWGGRPFAEGEATFFEIAGCYPRYPAPFCRTVFLGRPPQDMLDAEKALVEGLEAGLEAARAGNRAGQVADALFSTLEKAGIRKEGRCGYPIGLSYPPDWGERTISFRRDDETVLEPGMTFHFMPGLWMADWGLEITESILCPENGPAEPLCNRPRKLIVKDSRLGRWHIFASRCPRSRRQEPDRPYPHARYPRRPDRLSDGLFCKQSRTDHLRCRPVERGRRDALDVARRDGFEGEPVRNAGARWRRGDRAFRSYRCRPRG